MLKIKEELFVDIKGYDGRYKIGNKGTVIGVSRSNDNRYKDKQWILKQYQDRNGYMYVTLQKDKKRKTIKVHRLVAENFLENPDNLPQINHKDGNKLNNVVSNLEWISNYDNMQHAIKNGLINQELRKENMSTLGKSLKGHIARFGLTENIKNKIESMEYKVKE